METFGGAMKNYRPKVNDRFNAYTVSHGNLHRCAPFTAYAVRGIWVSAKNSIGNWAFRTTEWDFEYEKVSNNIR